ncbi:MAG TPA: hypothetical protein PLZ36_02190 [Armatimonadota bacterium]|nr:hypothetical protein [Armatimonadota bacterium]
MTLSQRLLILGLALCLGVGQLQAQTKRTAPPESLNGLRPGTLTLDDLTAKMGKPDMVQTGGMLELYGGPADSEAYGWFMIDNPGYTVPDLAVETARGSDRVDLVMAIGFDGLKTEKGITCFMTEREMLDAYGKPDFVFAVPMQGFTLREFYYINQGISFDVAPLGPGSAERQVIAIYVTYPEYLKDAVALRHTYISEGIGRDITTSYLPGTNT